MPSSALSRYSRRLSAGVLCAAVAAVIACDDSTGTDDEPRIASMRLTVGGQAMSIDAGGARTPTSFSLPVGTHQVSAVFLRADGTEETRVTGANFILRVTAANTTVVSGFARSTTNPFAGTLTAAAEGSTTLSVDLFHTREGHPDFGPFTIPITITAP